MDIRQMQYYVYRHIRNDTNEVFYIGVGKKRTRFKTFLSTYSEFERAYSKRGRSPFWNRVANKTNYTVDILVESNNLNFIHEKEKEFIKLYGRRTKNKGTLVNITTGGHDYLTYELDTHPRSRKVVQIDPITNKGLKMFDCITNAIKEVGLKSPSSITNVLAGRCETAGGYKWRAV